MKKVVYYIAARKGGGGETILDQYYQKAVEDTVNEWWFFVPFDKYKECKHVHIKTAAISSSSLIGRYIKRNLIERTELRQCINHINPDELISLQNSPIAGIKCKQTVYLHQSLQFSPVRYSFFRKHERSFAFRQHVICRLIRRRIRSADKIVVQTEWMKRRVSEWAKYPISKVFVETPCVDIPQLESQYEKKTNCFFYPANPYPNKNHDILLDACSILIKRGVSEFTLDLTFDENAGNLAKELIKKAKARRLPIRFVGHLSKEELYKRYGSEIMLFPSYMETFGLPLLEAKSSGGIILSSDTPFAHEILEDYPNSVFLPYNMPDMWASFMQQLITNGVFDDRNRKCEN